MKKINDIEQMRIPGMEEFRNHFSSTKIKILANSWAGVFREFVLTKLPVHKLSQFYNGSYGRPSKELLALMGAVVLQQCFNLTDEETIFELAFNQQWHFALDCYDEKDQVISLKTLWTMRSRIAQADLGNEIFELVTDKLIKVFEVDTSHQRIDSVHVYSNMAKLSRVLLLAKTIECFLKELKKNHMEIYNTKVEQRIKDIFFKEKGTGVFSQVKPSESEKKLQTLAEDMNSLLLLFANEEEINTSKSFKIMEKVFSQQCKKEDEKILIKAPKEVPSDSIQNPSDPDASYSGHKGQGYQTQLGETYIPDNGNEEDPNQEKALTLITYIKTEPASCHDSHAMTPFIDNLESRNICPQELLADTLYGKEENILSAKEKGIDLISPVPGNKNNRGLEKFTFHEKSFEIMSCPQNHKPSLIFQSNNERFTAKWDNNLCNHCPFKDNCATEKQKEYRVLYYRKTEAFSCIRRVKEQTDEFKDKYRYRSGIEGTNTRFIHQTEGRRSRYRGNQKMSMSQSLKALFINIYRVSKNKVWKDMIIIFSDFYLKKVLFNFKFSKIRGYNFEFAV